jgi:hypothetical protein
MGRKTSGKVGVEHLLACEKAIEEIDAVLSKYNLGGRRKRKASKRETSSSQGPGTTWDES